MKLSDAPVGAFVVDGRDVFRVLADDFTLDSGHRLTDKQVAELGVAVGNGNANPTVSVRGRRWVARDAEVTGKLMVQCAWTSDGPAHVQGGLFALYTTGHDLVPVEEFMLDWDQFAIGNVKHHYRIYETDKPLKLAAIANPKPLLPYDKARQGIRSTEPLSTEAEILHESLLTYVKVEPTDQPWIGPECDRPVVVVDEDGDEYRIMARLLIPDSYSSVFRRRDERELEKRTKPYREQMRAALRAVANSIGAPADVTITPTTITMPLEVLEALVLGDEYGISQVVDGVAILRDEVRIFRGEEPE